MTETLYGRKKFLNYIKGKFVTQAKSKWEMDFFVHPLRFKKKHFLILKQNNKREDTTILSVEFKNHRVYIIHLFPTKPVEFTFLEPSYSFTKAKELMLNEKMFNAAERLNIKIVMKCIRKGANINALNIEGETALTLLSKASRFDHVKGYLAEYLALIDEGQVEMVLKMKAEFEKAGNDFSDGRAGTGLFDEFIMRSADISQNERIEMMRKLIEKGADLNYQSLSKKKDACNPLYYALLNAESETLEFLLKYGADPNFKYPCNEEMGVTLYEDACIALQIQVGAGKEYFERERIWLFDGKTLEMQEKEIEELKKIVELLKPIS